MYARHTTVGVGQSRGEIERLQARVQFRLHDRIVRFVIKLPDRHKLSGPRYEQAERQRWRALLLVLKAKLESVESAIETFEHAFLSQIVMPNDQTVGDLVLPHVAIAYKGGRMPRALLEAPEEDR